MNFPSEDILKVISKEFPNSEFVFSSATNAPELRWKVPSHFIKYNCPTCEELGEWLHDKGWNVPYSGSGEWGIYSNTLAHEIFKAKNETQARANAVKLILEDSE